MVDGESCVKFCFAFFPKPPAPAVFAKRGIFGNIRVAFRAPYFQGDPVIIRAFFWKIIYYRRGFIVEIRLAVLAYLGIAFDGLIAVRAIFIFFIGQSDALLAVVVNLWFNLLRFCKLH